MKNLNKQYSASGKYIRISPYKVRRVARLIKGMSYDVANATLKSLPQRGGVVIQKVLKSAYSNAVNNFNENGNLIVVDSVIVNEGPRLKRFKPQARGRIFKIIKRSCHIKVVVSTMGGN